MNVFFGGVFVIADIQGSLHSDLVNSDLPTTRHSDQALLAPEPDGGVRTVVMFVYPMIQLLDVVGPLEVMAAASEAAIRDEVGASYRLEICGPARGPVRASSGLEIGAGRSWQGLPEEIDTVIVAGGFGCIEAAKDAELLEAIRTAASRARRVCSV